MLRQHSQLDNGAVGWDDKVAGCEPVWISSADAIQCGIADGGTVQLFNDRCTCFAGTVVIDRIQQGVVQITTDAWRDRDVPGKQGSRCKHSNFNVLMLDKGTSRLAQGRNAQTCLVEIERLGGAEQQLTAFDPSALPAGLNEGVADAVR